jgi:hypothetical protein
MDWCTLTVSLQLLISPLAGSIQGYLTTGASNSIISLGFGDYLGQDWCWKFRGNLKGKYLEMNMWGEKFRSNFWLLWGVLNLSTRKNFRFAFLVFILFSFLFLLQTH